MGPKKKELTVSASYPEPNIEALNQACQDFAKTIVALRGPGGCPWDREQTLSSLRRYLIEESYEAVSACEDLIHGRPNGADEFCDELGDVLLQVFLNSQIALEQNLFSVVDVFRAINEKMIRRHPHVFKENIENIQTTDEVLNQWGKIKETEKGGTASMERLFAKVERKKSQPTLVWASAISARAHKLGFTWNDLHGVFSDLKSEVKELQEELFKEKMDIHRVTDELGDVVYALANLTVFLRETCSDAGDLDLELAARHSLEKFLERFRTMEDLFQEQQTPLTEKVAKSIDLDTWNDFWKQAKERLKNRPIGEKCP